MGQSEMGDEAVRVVTAMPLSAGARADLSAMLGSGYAVVDIKAAPATANILLTPVVSRQLLGSLRRLFPDARILFTELHDDGRGISFSGPLSRIAADRPDGYFIAHALDSLVPIVHSQARLQLGGSRRPTPPRIGPSEAFAPGPTAPPPPPHAAPSATVVWVQQLPSETPLPGRWLDLEPIDALVTSLLHTAEPRHHELWAALVAECAAHLARNAGDDTLVDVRELHPAVLAELRIRVASELIPQRTWAPSEPSEVEGQARTTRRGGA